MSEENVILEWQVLFDSKQTVGKVRNALAGDGAGVVDVSGEPGFIWCRYSADQSKVSKVFNIIAPGIPEDFPIKVGRRFATDEFEQVLAVDWTQYQDIISQDTVDNFTTGNHGESHNAADGADPAPIDLRNLIEMRVRAQDMADLTVHVERTQYLFGDEVKRYPGVDLDLSGSVPAVAGHRYVFVYVDGATNTATSTDGTIVPLAVAAPIPDPVSGTIPGALVDLENGQTTITEDDIFDWRLLWQITSFIGPVLVGTNAERLALTLASLAELTRFYTTDTDKIWEVWEGAWRLIYPPSALSDSAGNSGTPWSTDASGVLTGSQDLVLDDGVGDSPSVLWRGGSNDDEIQIFLDDDAVAGHSDLVFNLADSSGNSEYKISDVTSRLKFQFNSDGQMTQTQRETLTNTIATFLTWKHETTATAAAGFGSQWLVQLEDAGGAMEDAAAISFEWENAGAAAEGTLIRFWLRKGGVALGPFIEFGATENVFNESSADIDFRVEGDGEADLLFVNAGTDRVGIGTNAPTGRLHTTLSPTTTEASFVITHSLENVGVITVPQVLSATFTDRSTANRTSGQLLRFSYVRNAAATGIPTAFDGLIVTNATIDSNLASELRALQVEGPLVTAGNTLNTYTGLRIQDPGGAGTTTTFNAIVTTGGRCIFNENSGDYDFRIESNGSANMFFLDAGNDRVGIKNGSPSYELDVTGVIGVSDNAGDPGTVANKATFYGKDVAGTVEAFAQDEAGNAAQLTPHNFDGPVQPLPDTLHWSQYHQNVYLGQKKWYDMERALLALETLTGQQFVFTELMDTLEKRDWYMDQAAQGKRKPMPSWMKGT